MRLLIFCLFIVLFCGSCSHRNYLNYYLGRAYKEVNSYQEDKSVYIKQIVRYDRRYSMDEEFSFGIIFQVDQVVIDSKKIIYLPQDSALLTYRIAPPYRFNFAGNSSLELTGTVQFQRNGESEIRIKENLLIINSNQKLIGRAKGRRVFMKDSSAINNYFN